jgi:pyridoxal phosphate enzyme (YggS family)
MNQAGKGSIRENYLHVLDKIEKAAVSVGREPSSVRLIVVTKGHPVETIQHVIDAGARVFGENYVEEGIQKLEMLGSEPQLQWHMIGHVQSRKAMLVCEHFDYLHSLDGIKIAMRLDRYAGQLGIKLPVLLECNVSGEETKFGWPAWQENSWQALADDFSEVLGLSNLEVRGLMTMAPFFDQPEPARPYFRKLRRLQEFLAELLPEGKWQELSMGMSGDFMIAIEEGATMVRIGTSILGERPRQVVAVEERRT